MDVHAILWFFAFFLPSFCEREHKVHNIVLYPEKHSWCKTTKIEQIVTMPGYEPMTIENNVCVGACYSYSIPRTQPAEPGELIGPYCDSCQPANSKCYHVTLKADNKNPGPKTAKKRVQIITNCTCQACSKIPDADCEILEEKTSELPTDLFSVLTGNQTFFNNSKQEEIPELLNINHTLNASSSNVEPLNENINEVLRKKLIQSLSGTIDRNDFKKGNDLLKQLIAAIEDPRNRFSDDNLLSLFTFTSPDHVDLEKIKEILIQVKQERELVEKHRNFGIGHFVPIENNLKNSGHYKGPRYGIETNIIHETAPKPHHHFIGEIQNVGLTSGHLTKGPHGSLVLVPKVEQKFHLPSDNVKPNEEGLIIQYETI